MDTIAEKVLEAQLRILNLVRLREGKRAKVPSKESLLDAIVAMRVYCLHILQL